MYVNEKVKILADAFYAANGLLVSYYDKKTQKILPVSETASLNVLTQGNLEIIVKQHDELQHGEVFFDHNNPINCLWFVVASGQKNSDEQGLYILGPTFLTVVDFENLLNFIPGRSLQDNQFINFLIENIKQIPIIPYGQLVNNFQILYYTLFEEAFDLSKIDITNQSPHILKDNEEVIENLHQRDLDEEINNEQIVLSYIREGAVERLEANPVNPLSMMSPQDKSNFRSVKNNLIIKIALATRASVEGGLLKEISYQLCEMYFEQLELSKNTTQAFGVFQTAILDFTSRVRNEKNKHIKESNSYVNQAISYIWRHVNDPLSVKDVAKAVNIDSDVLTKKFRQTLGTTAQKYITKTKIEEAKMLLEHSNHSLIEIATLLSYSSQSQFNVAFKRETGLTPMKFRQISKR